MPPSSVLLFHKVPAFWESEARSNLEKPHPVTSDFPPINDLSPEVSIFLSGFEEDIFFVLACIIADFLSIE